MDHRRSFHTRDAHRPSSTSWLSVLVICLAVWASIASATEPVQPNEALFKTCYLSGLSDRLQCGKLAMPEDPNQPDGKTIDVHYVVIPAIKPAHPSEAVLAIAGGPGQSAIDNAAGFARVLRKVREQRDILLIDQRGTGRSNLLTCEQADYSALAYDDNQTDIATDTQACLTQHSDTDITQYTSSIALQDFESIRQYLGYDKLHLYGVSYGTRMAQLYMRHYPQHLATVTLDGVVPMQQSVLAITDAIERATRLMLKDCEHNSVCHQQYPNLAKALEQIDAQLSHTPYRGQVADPYTGEPTELLLTRAKFLTTVRMALYSNNTKALLPHAITQASKGNYQAILGLYSLSMGNIDLAMGMHSSIVCAEDLPRLTPQLRNQMQQTYNGQLMLKGLEQACQVWKMPAVTAEFSAAIDSDIPTLLLSGKLDPATPPSWGDLAMEKMTNAKHLVSPYATHGVAYQSCAHQLIAKLVTTRSIKEVDGSCLEKDVSRSFYLNASSVEPAAINPTKD